MEVQNGIPPVYLVTDERPARGNREVKHSKPWNDTDYDRFDEETIKRERDERLEEIDKQKSALEETARNLEEIDSPYSKKAGKLFRFGASLIGIAGTFLASKYSAKLTIETIKSVAKNPKLADTVKNIDKVKKPISELAEKARTVMNDVMEKPAVKTKIEAVINSKALKTAKAVLENKAVVKILEPLKNTFASAKNIKVNGKSIQSAVENTMAATTTGCVIVDDLTGRNNDKSAVDLAVCS